MNIPDFKCSVEMYSSVNSSEDPKKIQMAISNIFPNSTIDSGDFSIYAKSDDLRSFEKIAQAIRSKQSEKTYRRTLEKHIGKNTTWFYLNKQAAFVEKVAICEEADESPLGPIKVVLTSPNIEEVVDWVAFGENED